MLARSPKRVARFDTPNAIVTRTDSASAVARDAGTRTGVRSPSGTGCIHIVLATPA